MSFETKSWIFFNLGILFLIFIDLFTFHRKAHTIKIHEALWASLFWITLALFFNYFIYVTRGSHDALNFFTGYIVEKSLSVDNLFVFILIFSYFKVPSHLHHKVLFWGILGAIIMRAFFILFGIALVSKFHWIFYVFGAFLLYTGFKLGFEKEKKIDPESNFLIQLFSRWIPITHEYVNDKFFVWKKSKLFATPLCVALITIETTDLIFAVDSIPAILGITFDPFIAYTSNILAILGLRSLYFVLASLIDLFRYLKYGLAAILIFIGVKMLISGWIEIPIFLSLGLILFILIITILFSIIESKRYGK